jgi:hypothetical protein
VIFMGTGIACIWYKKAYIDLYKLKLKTYANLNKNDLH